mgnify:CR=1 FL=1
MSNLPKYHLVYPEKNVSWMSSTPNKCMFERAKQNCQIMRYTPTTCSRCSSTFNPADRPSPSQCLKMCKGIDVSISACDAERLMYHNPPTIINNGCLKEPSVAEYTNMPMNFFRNRSILNNPLRNPPNVSQVDQKYSDYYDPILSTYGRPYTY